MLWPGESSLEEFETSDVAKIRLAPGIWTLALRFNLSAPFDDDPTAAAPHPLFGDVKVRQAIGMAINRERIVNEVLNDVVLIDSIFSVGWIQSQVEPWKYDPDGAMALLEEAGWMLDGDVRQKDGVKAEFVCNGYTNFTPNELAQLAIQEDLAKVGISMSIENQDFAVIFGTWEDQAPRMTGDYDAMFYDGGFFIEPHESIRRQYHPNQVPSEQTPSGQNYWRWVREDVGEWIDAAGATPDLEERRANYQKVADAMREDVVNIPILQFTEGSAYATNLHGFTVSTWEYSTWDVENWWLEQ
jgi:peptide/nickel transport system substrate-binding protein